MSIWNLSIWSMCTSPNDYYMESHEPKKARRSSFKVLRETLVKSKVSEMTMASSRKRSERGSKCKEECEEPTTAAETPRTHRNKYSVKSHLNEMILMEEQESAKENIREQHEKGANEEILQRGKMEGENSYHDQGRNMNEKRSNVSRQSENP